MNPQNNPIPCIIFISFTNQVNQHKKQEIPLQMKNLTPSQRKHLKGLGHGLKPCVQVGKEGITEKVLGSIAKALNDHELIKIGLLETAGLDRKDAAQDIANALNAELVQVLGFKILLFRRNPDEPKISLPEA